MRTTLIALALLLFTSPVYADQHSNEAEEDSKGNDFFCPYSKAC